MGVDVVTMSYQSKDYIEFLKGDTVQIGTQIFTCSAPAAFERDRKWSYELEFLSKAYQGNDAQMLGLDENNNLTEYECYLTGDANAVVDLIILNANRIGAGWVKGVVDETETIDFDFTGDTCNTALVKLSDQYQTEFWWENDTIHLTKKGSDSGLSFRHGKGKGLTKLARKNTGSKVATRLHIYGSKQNLPTTYPGLSKRLRMTDGVKYIEDPAKVAKYGLIEDTKVFEDVFPKRVGTITSVTNELTFSDTSIDFDLNTHLVDGVSAKVKFLTGQLAGYIFEIKENGYKHNSKTITILINKNEQAMVVPSANGMQPAVGDQYIFLDVIMPAIDITNAEAELATKGQEAYEETSDPIVQYDAEIDRRYLREDDMAVKLGDFVNIADTDAGIDKDIRVISKRTNLQDPYDITIELSETTAVANIVKQMINDKVIQKAIGNAKLTDVARQRLNWRTTAELSTMLDTLRAEMLLIMVDGGNYSTTIIYTTNGNTFQSSAGTVTHDEFVDNGGIWNVPALTVTLPTNVPYYFYIRADRSSQVAVMVYSPTKIGLDDEAGFYHFPFGILSSQFSGQRLFSSTKGYTKITGANIQTGKITSSDGKTWFDLDNGEFRGSFKFTSGEDVRESLEGYADTVINDSFEESIEYVNAIRDNLQNQIDGVIESYFDDYEPTLSNYPASTWDTTEKKDEHLGDTFSNDSTGKSYRWTLEAGNYYWKEIADTDALLALQKAQKAQDTADGKRRTFLNQPVGPYDRGDMWMTGADILVSTTNRPLGAYTAGDWIKLDKYTDDTRANQAEVNAKAYADTLKQAIDAEIEDINTEIGELDTTLNGAFRDGIIDEAEASAIKLQIKLVDNEKSDLDSRYNSIYNETQLTGDNKTNLGNAKAAYDASYTGLVNTINNAIVDGKVVPDEIASINAAFADYRAKLGSLSSRLQQAISFIAQAKVNNLQIGGRNYIKNSHSLSQIVVCDTGISHTKEEDDTDTITVGQNAGNFVAIFGGLFFLNELLYKDCVFSFEIFSNSSTFLPNIYISDTGYIPLIGSLSNSWSKVYVKYTSGQNDRYFHLGFNGVAGTYHLKNFKFERGNKPTDWTPAPEDVEADATAKANAAKQAAIDSAKLYADTQIQQTDVLTRAYADGIVTDAEALAIAEAAEALRLAKEDATAKAGAVDAKIGPLPSGKTIIKDGMINTDLIVTDTLIAKQVQTQGTNSITLNQNEDNLLKFRHKTTGVVGIEMGIVDGQMKLVFYNENGQKVWEGGMAGIIYVDNVPESWSPANRYVFLGNWGYPLDSNSEFQIKNNINSVTSAVNINGKPTLVVAGGSNLYLYSAGKNPDSSLNSQYNGYHTQTVKTTASFASDGWYLSASANSFTKTGENLYTVSLLQVQIQNGLQITRNVFLGNVLITGGIS